MAAFPLGTITGHFRVSLNKPGFLATGSVIPERKYEFQTRFSVVFYFISQESLAKRADMPVIFIYNHCIEKSPPTLSIKVVLGFPFGVQKRMQIR